MVLIDAVISLGRTVANIAHDVCRPDILIGRDKHYFAGKIRGLSDEKKDIPFSSINVAGHKMPERSVCCLKSLHGNYNEKPIIAVILPLTSDVPPPKVRSTIDEFAFAGLCRRGAKRLLNATKISIRAPLSRGICTLVNPMEMKLKKMPSYTNPLINQQLRFRRKDCAEWCGEDPCCLINKDSLKKPSMWLDPDCYNKLVCERPFRYDIVHMPGSDKATREYQRTWIECPPRIIPKVVCCPEPLEMPPICRRPRKIRPSTAKSVNCVITQKETLVKERCPKAPQSPCCEVARASKLCKIYPTYSCCQKRCTPFPSFSECCHLECNKKGPIECLCLARPTMCEIHADWRKRYLGTNIVPLKFTAFPE